MSTNFLGIEQDKNWAGDGVAYNAGRVKLYVDINTYCPEYLGRWAEYGLSMNSETLKTFPDSFWDSFAVVPGEMGVFLKPYYFARSNFLEQMVEDSSTLQYSTLNVYSFVQPVDQSGDTPNFEENFAIYQADQTFLIMQSPILVGNASDQWKTGGGAGASSDTSMAFSWQYDFEDIDTYKNSPITMLPYGQYENGNNRQICSQVKNSESPDKPVHWRLVKNKPLFRGEDFFIDFFIKSPNADVPNMSGNRQMQPFADEFYCGIDPYFTTKNIPQGAKPASNPSDESLFFDDETENGESVVDVPENQGVALYKVDYDDNGNPTSYVKDDKTSEYFDVNNQAYFIIEIGVGEVWEHYFILIPENYYPSMVRAIRVEDKLYSYAMGIFKGVSGRELFSQEKFRVTVRNHLGKFVVTFTSNGMEDRVWVISPLFNPTRTGDKIRANVVPAAEIAIWGGHRHVSVAFSPLMYKDKANFRLPTLGNTDNQATKKAKPFEVSGKGIGKHYVVLSDLDHGLEEPLVQAEQKYIDYHEWYTQHTKYPFFTCDAQKIVEGCSEGTGPVFLEDKIKFRYTDIKLRDKAEKPSTIQLQIKDAKVPSPDTFSFFLFVFLMAGHHKDEYGCVLEDSITPILTNMRVISVPDWEPAWPSNTSSTLTGVGDLVLSYTENWEQEDMSTIDHTATISFLIGDHFVNPEYQTKADVLKGMTNRNFYITVDAEYIVTDTSPPTTCNYTRVDGRWRLFTGICSGGTIHREPGKTVMDCKIETYKTIMDNTVIINSPFFDGVRDTNAVYELLMLCGLRDDVGGPGHLVKHCANSNSGDHIVDSTGGAHGGRWGVNNIWALPFSWDRLQQPLWRFANGEKIWNKVVEMAKKAGKTVWFDNMGQLHYDVTRRKLAYFNPAMVFSPVGQSQTADWYFITRKSLGTGQLIFETMTLDRDIQGVFTDIHLISTTPNFEVIIAHDTNWPGVEDPGAPGFLGYRKMFYQQEAMFGNQQSVAQMVEHYKDAYNSHVNVEFKTFGQPILPGDNISLNGKLFFVQGVSSEISPETGRWWQTIRADRLPKNEADAMTAYDLA